MYISNNPAVINGFKRWSVDHLEQSKTSGPSGGTDTIIATDPNVYGPNKPPIIPTGTGSV